MHSTHNKMITIKVKIEANYSGSKTDWVLPADEASRPLFMFVTAGTIGVPLWKWESETEKVVNALGWVWALAPLSALPNV